MHYVFAATGIAALMGAIVWSSIVFSGGRTPAQWWYDRRWLHKIRKTCTHPAWRVDEQIHFHVPRPYCFECHRWVRLRRSSSPTSTGERPFF